MVFFFEMPQITTPQALAFDAELGRRVRDRRRLADLSQADLAAVVGVSFQQIQKYEYGANRLSAYMLVKLATALRVAPGELLPPVVEHPTPHPHAGGRHGEGDRDFAN